MHTTRSASLRHALGRALDQSHSSQSSRGDSGTDRVQRAFWSETPSRQGLAEVVSLNDRRALRSL